MKILPFFLLMLFACGKRNTGENGFQVVKGKMAGASYEIAYDSSLDIRADIEKTLGRLAGMFSLTDSQSLISKFNHGINLSPEDVVVYKEAEKYFQRLDSLSRRIHSESGGAFNPGLGSLMNYWGFGETQKHPDPIEQRLTDSLKKLNFGYRLAFNDGKPFKSDARQQLNFNAIAPGLAADILAGIFDSVWHFKNYYINISGEIRVRGNNGHDSYWPIRIEKPMLNALKSTEYCKIPLKNYSLSGSDSYHHFYFSKGKRYSHIIDPRSASPVRNGMLSATVLAPTAAEADAYASACMVLGKEKAAEMIVRRPELKAFFIYEENGEMKHWSTANLAYEPAKKN